MNQRKLFLLFLSAMSISIVVMVIIYGLFLKDFELNLDVKNPQSAPSPIDALNGEGNTTAPTDNTVYEDGRPRSNVLSPDEAGQSHPADSAGGDPATEQTVNELTPLAPQVGQHTPEPPSPPEAASSDPLSATPDGDAAGTPSLHYVYLDGFSSRTAAEQAIQQLQDRPLAAQPYIRQYKGEIILQFGVFSERANAEILGQQLRKQNVFVKVD